MSQGLIKRVMKSGPAAVFAACLTAMPVMPDLARAAPGLPSTNVAWLAAAADSDVERVFAQARQDKKPLLLYWGASWCPPCNQLKATLFNRQDFALLSRSFVAVHVDGDRPGAQKLGQRFKVSGYPTVVVFNSDGTEVTRLPGEVDAPQMMAVLQLGLAGGRPVKAVLNEALAGKALLPTEWRLLSYYSWETDEQQLVAKPELASTLVRLAVASPGSDSETTTRLWLKALAASSDGQGVKADDALRSRVQAVLADPAQARLHMDVLSNHAPELVRNLHPSSGSARASTLALLDGALARLQRDSSLSRGDRHTALLARVELARLDLAKDDNVPDLPEPLLSALREQVATLDREITDPHERQAVITAAAYTLSRAGLWADSDALLKNNLAKSHSSYYLMSQLGSNARKQGRTQEALGWYAQAFDKSVGPATRLQWGASYLTALVDLAPKDRQRIEKTAATLLSEAARDSGAFDARSLRSLQRASSKLLSWNAQGQQAATLNRLHKQALALCPKVEVSEGQRAACEALFR